MEHRYAGLRSGDRGVAEVLPVRDQARVILDNTRDRLQTLLPVAMREQGIDMWLVVCEEDALDPVFRAVIPLDTWCPILQILVFFDRGRKAGVERINISGTDTADLFDHPYTGQIVEEQWRLLHAVVADRDPARIGINVGEIGWAASGLTHSLHKRLLDALPEGARGRVESAEPAATRFLATLTDGEAACFEQAAAISHDIIAACYSRTVLHPGVTTTTDLTWAYWQRLADRGLMPSFKPAFYLIRHPDAIARWGAADRTIRPGDFVRCDVGLQYLRLNSDHQHWCYCRRPGEQQAPAPMRALLAEANRLQEVFADTMAVGKSGDELLAAMLAAARKAGIPGAKVYSHSLGLFLHEPGALIGLPWEQGSNPGRGDVVVQANQGFVMELSATDEIPGWGPFTAALEEDCFFDGSDCHILDGRQTDFYLI